MVPRKSIILSLSPSLTTKACISRFNVRSYGAAGVQELRTDGHGFGSERPTPLSYSPRLSWPKIAYPEHRRCESDVEV